jgi:hypothetical protein
MEVPMRYLFLILFFSTNATAQETKIYERGLIYHKNVSNLGRTYSTFSDCDNLPDEFDLRDINVVPPIKDQGSCGSCWAFAKTASLESANAVANGEMLNLSEQELVSCDGDSYGCDGGFLSDFRYQIQKGQGLETDFPYAAKNLKCKKIDKKAKGIQFHYAGKPDRKPTEKEVMCAMFHSKTVPWTIVAAEGQWDQAPTSDDGIMQRCGSRNINHAVGLVGWKTIGGKVYFKVRNSWGPEWGSTAGKPGAEKGYTLASHGCNLLNEEVAYIVTEKTCKPPMIYTDPLLSVPANKDFPVSIKEVEPDTEYSWHLAGKKVGRGTVIYVNQDRNMTYLIKAKNPCGQSELAVKVEVKP